MSSWNAFQRQCKNSGLSRSEISYLYQQYRRDQAGGGNKTTQLKNLASSLAKHGDELISLGKSLKEFHSNLHETDPTTGKKVFKGVSAIDMNKLSALSKQTQTFVGKIADTHEQLSKSA